MRYIPPQPASKQTPLAFLMFNIGGSSEEDPCLPHGVGISDAHRHPRNGRPCGRTADDRKRHAARPHTGSKGIDAGGNCCVLFQLQSAYHRADAFCPSGLLYLGHQAQLQICRLGYAGRPYVQLDLNGSCGKTREIRPEGPDARPASGSGQSRIVFQSRDIDRKRATVFRPGRAFSFQ